MRDVKSTTRNGNVRRKIMADARHPKLYPKGPKYPKKVVTPAWKRTVLERLAENKQHERPPRTEAELARMIGADKGGLHDLLHGDQSTYKYAKQVSEILGIGDAMVANPALTEDEWDRAVRRMRELSPERQRQVLAILRTFDVDDE